MASRRHQPPDLHTPLLPRPGYPPRGGAAVSAGQHGHVLDLWQGHGALLQIFWQTVTGSVTPLQGYYLLRLDITQGKHWLGLADMFTDVVVVILRTGTDADI